MAEKVEFTFPSFQDDLEIYVTAFIPEQENLKGIIQVVHGMSEHRHRYEPFLKHLASEGYVAVIHDHRGHGESVKTPNDYGYMYERSGTYLVEDTHQLTFYMKQEFPDVPYYLFGHSMGSLVVRAYAKKYDYELNGLIVCGSPSKNPLALAGQLLVQIMRIFKGEYFRSSFVHKLAFGKFNEKFSNGTSENRWVCSDDGVVEEYDKDDRCGFIFTLNGFENMFRLMRNVYDDDHWLLANKELPILFIAGKEDPCIISEEKFKEAHNFKKDLGYKNIEAKLYPEMRHEILNESKKEVVYQDVLDFIQRIEAQLKNVRWKKIYIDEDPYEGL